MQWKQLRHFYLWLPLLSRLNCMLFALAYVLAQGKTPSVYTVVHKPVEQLMTL